MTIDAVLIAGPTASGKSAAALSLAKALNGQIINADSMQVYDAAPILTARPTAQEMASAPHALFGHVPPTQVYSVGQYVQDAKAAIAAARAAGRMPILVGGTGLYFTALTDGLAQIPPVPDDIRNAARALLDEIGVGELHARLAAKDAKTASRLRPTDPQRVLRAYEVFEATGRPLADWQEEAHGQPILKDMTLARFVLDPPRPQLREAIARRFEMMLEKGALEEAALLKHLDSSLPAAKLLGLAQMIALAEGRLGREEALEQAITATRQFAKRQMTWFRNRMGDYVWFNPYESNIVSIYDRFSA